MFFRRIADALQNIKHSRSVAQVKARTGRFITAARGWSARHLPGGEVTMWVVVALVVLALFVWLVRPGNSMFGPDSEREARPVAVAVAKKGSIDITRSALGTVTPLATATVTPQVSGQIIRIDFREGDMVKAGQELAQIDPRTYQAALDKAKGTLANARATLANAQIELKRQQALAKANATSKQDLDSAVAAVQQDAGTVKADEAAVESAAVDLGFTKIVSPITGRIGLRGVDLGNYVSAGQSTGIAVVTQMQPMSVLFAIPEDSVQEILQRMNAGKKLVVDAYDRSFTKKLAEGLLVATDSEISTSTGTLKMRAQFDNSKFALFPNQFVNVKVHVETLKDRVLVPVTAIQRGSQGTYMFVVAPDKTVSMRTVTLGVQDADVVAVTKGLNPGETVVTDGADRLSDGTLVTIPSGQQVEKVQAADNAREVDFASQRKVLMRKLTPPERDQLRQMKPDERNAWLKAHSKELMKRKNTMGPPRGGPGGPPPP